MGGASFTPSNSRRTLSSPLPCSQAIFAHGAGAEGPSQDRYTLQEARRWAGHRHHQRAHKDGDQSAGDDQREELGLDNTLAEGKPGQYKRELAHLGQGKAGQ